MLQYMIPLLGSFLNSGIMSFVLPCFILAFIATVPCIIRSIIGSR